METEAEAMQELLSVETDLEAQFDRAQRADEVERQLQELKKKVKKS